MALHSGPPKRKEIYKYEAPWPLYSMNWSVRPDKRFRLALGSFVEEYNNKVQIVSLDEDTSEFVAKSTFDHPYPTTKIMWIPDSKGTDSWEILFSLFGIKEMLILLLDKNIDFWFFPTQRSVRFYVNYEFRNIHQELNFAY